MKVSQGGLERVGLRKPWLLSRSAQTFHRRLASRLVSEAVGASVPLPPGVTAPRHKTRGSGSDWPNDRGRTH